MTPKEKRSIELARRFIDTQLWIGEDGWRQWSALQKDKPLRPDQVKTVKQYSDGHTYITGESMFLLHHSHGITLPQVEKIGFICTDVVYYARLLHGYRLLAVTVTDWRRELLYEGHGGWPPLTLQELRDDGFSDIAESLRADIVKGWRDGKHGLPPGMDVANFKE